tara:strand:- start:23 stop:700 length:678 start_codon:yes stop_codon:yes gene_type:complete
MIELKETHERFSPTIMQFKVSDRFLNIVNNTGDAVLPDDGLSKKFDFSGNLVGKVSKEIRIPIIQEDDKEYYRDTIKEACLTYLKYMIEKNRAYEWTKGGGTKEPTKDNIQIAQSWIVSQYKHEYNPMHYHSGNFSGVIYLRIPKDMNKQYDEEFKDHYPASGLIEFMFGEKANFRSDNVKFMPEVGTMLLFPSWLKHTVYPFYVNGERRSMSFNAYHVGHRTQI